MKIWVLYVKYMYYETSRAITVCNGKAKNTSKIYSSAEVEKNTKNNNGVLVLYSPEISRDSEGKK